MEDEECLPENSNLKVYLQNLGFYDFQIKNVPSSSSNIKFDLSSSKLKRCNVEFIDDETIKQIGILISTRMLFEEDVRNIENLLSFFTIKKCSMLRSMFQGKFGIIAIFFGMLLYWVIGSYAFFVCSSFYAYKAADYLWKKNYSQIRLKRLASTLQTNYILLNKTFKFIQENDKFVPYNDCSEKEFSDDFKSGFEFYENFRSDFHSCMKEIVSVLSKSTQKLILKLPLYDYVENPQYYVCNNVNLSALELTDTSRLYQIYLLVQSEFLHRLILSLIPNLNLTESKNFQELNKVLIETSYYILKVKNNLNKKFKFFFFNGIHCKKTKSNLNLSYKPTASHLNYEAEFASNVHELSNSFQNLLIKSRIFEENLRSEKALKSLENDLLNMHNELSFCQRNISDGFILLKKACGETDNCKVEEVKESLVGNTDVESNRVLVGFTDLNPKIEDEIFEAYFAADSTDTDFENIDDWELEDILKKKLQKEYSTNVMKELKLKLVEKAKNWEKREAELLKKKCSNQNQESDTRTQNLINEPINFSEKLIDCNKQIDYFNQFGVKNEVDGSVACADKKCQFQVNDATNCLNKPATILYHKEKNEHEKNDIKQYFSEEYEFHQNSLEAINPNFLGDLRLAREKILSAKISPAEEYFCDSSESLEEAE